MIRWKCTIYRGYTVLSNWFTWIFLLQTCQTLPSNMQLEDNKIDFYHFCSPCVVSQTTLSRAKSEKPWKVDFNVPRNHQRHNKEAITTLLFVGIHWAPIDNEQTYRCNDDEKFNSKFTGANFDKYMPYITYMQWCMHMICCIFMISVLICGTDTNIVNFSFP